MEAQENRRGQLVDEIMVLLLTTFERRASSSVLDLTFLRPTIRRDDASGKYWKKSLRDHRYFCFELEIRKRDTPRDIPRVWAVKKFVRDAFAQCILKTPGLNKTRTTDHMTRHYTTEMSRAFDDPISGEDSTRIKGLLLSGTTLNL